MVLGERRSLSERQDDRADRMVRWRQVEAQLDLAERTARDWSAGRLAGDRSGPPLELAPGERVLVTLPALALVEAFRAPGRRRAEYTGYSARSTAALRQRVPVRHAEAQRVRGHGPVTVTDRRIVFHGPAECTEWPIEELIRVEHSNRRPVSLLHVAGRQTVLGLLYRVPDAGQVRLILELAVAQHRGDLAGLLAGLAADRRRHELERSGRRARVKPARRTARRLTQSGLALSAAVTFGIANPHQPGPVSPRLSLDPAVAAASTSPATRGAAASGPASRSRPAPLPPSTHRSHPARTTRSWPVTRSTPAGRTRAPTRTAGSPPRTTAATTTAPPKQPVTTSGPPLRSAK